MKRWKSPCGTVEMVHGDCREVSIPKNSIVITDPPFNIGSPQRIVEGRIERRYRGTKLGEDFGKDFDTGSLTPDQWVSRMPDTLISFAGAKQLANLVVAAEKVDYEIVQDFHWCKRNAPPPMRAIGFGWATESGYVFRKKGTKHVVNKKAGFSPNWFLCNLPSNKKHSTQKPEKVMNWLIRFLSLPESIIVDPFCGSGTTGVAAIKLGRSFLGIEKEEKYFDLSVQRLKNALAVHQGSFKLL